MRDSLSTLPCRSLVAIGTALLEVLARMAWFISTLLSALECGRTPPRVRACPIRDRGEMVVHQGPRPRSSRPACSAEGRGRRGIEATYLPWLIVATNTPPVSNSVRSPAFAGDSMGATEVSICPFTVLARAMVPSPGIEVVVGTQ